MTNIAISIRNISKSYFVYDSPWKRMWNSLINLKVNNVKEIKALDKINLEVKHRENWRPFCPSMKEEVYKKYIDSSIDSPFMIMAFPVNKKVSSEIPAVVHVDGTARPQQVSKNYNFKFWSLLNEFEKITGHAILINTSFNIQGEPVVCSPKDALRTFGGTGLDILVLGDYILEK